MQGSAHATLLTLVIETVGGIECAVGHRDHGPERGSAAVQLGDAGEGRGHGRTRRSGVTRLGHGDTLSHARAVYHRDVPYLLAVFALVVPVILVVQTVRGRVRLQCCAAEPGRDLRLNPVASTIPGRPEA